MFTKKLLLIMPLLALAACSDAPTAERVLTENGYTDIVTSGYAAFSCGKEDTFATGFTAIAPGGRRVKGVVCSAAFKGATIRFL